MTEDVCAAIAAIDGFLDPLLTMIAKEMTTSDIEGHSELDEEINGMPEGDVRTFAEIGVMVCRRRALEVHGTIGHR